MSLRVYYEVLNQRGTPALFTDTLVNRPAFGFQGRLFISTDSGQIFEDTGTAWTLVADAGVGGGTLSSVCLNGNTTATGIVITAGGLSSTTGTFSGIVTAPQIKALTSAGLSINANSGTQVADFGAGGSANLTLFGGLSGTSASFSSSITGNTIVKSGGTVNQFLKADGSVDSNSYFTTNTSETIAAGITKTFNNEMRFGLGTMYNNSTGVSLATGFTTINAALTGSNTSLQVWRNNGFRFTINCDLTTVGSTFVLPSGQTNALIATATGTSSQLIAGDGSLISAGTNITISGGTISSSGGGGGMAIGGSITSATAGSVLFAGASGVLAQDNANFFFDDTNNRLGLGTATPQVSLSVVSSGNNYGLFIGPNAGSTNGQRLKLGYFGTANYSVIQSIEDGIAATNLILQNDGGNCGIGSTTIGSRLQVNGNAAIGYSASTAAPNNGLAVSGNVAIGTSSASYTLDVNGTTNISANNFYRYNGDTGLIGSATSITGGTNTQLGIRAANDILFATNGANERMRIEGGGNIGIGTTTVGSKLQVNGNAAIGFSASTAAPTNGLVVKGLITGGSNYPTRVVNLDMSRESAFPSATFTFPNNGRFSVVEINAFGTNDVFFQGIPGTSAGYTILNDYNGAGLYLSTNGTGSATPIIFNIFNSERMRLNASGNLAIGTTTIGSKLQVNGNAAIGYSASTAAPTNGLVVNGTTLIGTSTDNGQGILQLNGSLTAFGVSISGEALTTSATLTKQYYHVFNGSTGQTLTLPSPASNNFQYVIINNTANTVTLSAATSTNIITTTGTSVASITLIANQRVLVIADGNDKYYQIF